mmetsp:Transcript_31615/g.49530  ORF Transcript_31615/g.49530 Transcript_31615/m.49530 type:complete len:166 (-) Transcript_31615:146-643(-)
MIIPVRCFTCNKTIGHLWKRYLELVESGRGTDGDDEEDGGAEMKAFDELGLKRYCCRRMLLTHVDLIEKLMLYNRTLSTVLDLSHRHVLTVPLCQPFEPVITLVGLSAQTESPCPPQRWRTQIRRISSRDRQSAFSGVCSCAGNSPSDKHKHQDFTKKFRVDRAG